MYWRTGSYPELSGKSKKEQRLVVQKAIGTYGKEINARFFGAVILCVALPVLASQLITSTNEFASLLIFLCPFAFYGYLLWEINGPMRRAFLKYQQELQQKHSTGSSS